MTVEINKIHNESCLDTMVKMPDDFVDLVITSPPYNMNLRIRNGAYCSRQIVKEFSTKYTGFDDNLPIDEFYKLHYKILQQLLRVSPLVFYNFQIVTGSKRAFFKIIGEFSDYLKDVIIWNKMNAQPSMHDNVLNSQYEFILIFDKYSSISRMFDFCNFGRGELGNVWDINRAQDRNDSNDHGATFPMELPARIIRNFSKENDLIYDPFVGTGTTASASKRYGRRYIGSEISEKYCEIAERRIRDTVENPVDFSQF